MKNKTTKTMLVIFIMLVLALSVSAATIHLTYTRPSDDYVVNTTTTSDSINITLPNIDLDLEIESSNQMFKVGVKSLSIEGVPILNVSSRDVEASNLDNDTIRLGTDDDYLPRIAYAFRIDNEDDINDTYNITFDYGGTDLNESNELIVFKFGFDFTTNTTDYATSSNYTEGNGLTVDTENNIVYFTTTSFSNFVLAEDTSTPREDTSSSSSRGSSGGGGGGTSTVSGVTVTVIPTVEGTVITAPVTTVFNVVYNEHTFPVEFVYANTVYAKLKHQISEEEWVFVPLFPKNVDIDQSGKNDIEIVMSAMDSSEGTFIFTLIEGVKIKDSPPYRSQQKQEPVDGGTDQPPPPQPPTPPPGTGAATEPAGEQPLPSSPITIWTVLLGLLFIIVLVGGVALYRRHLSMDKPPAAIRTGLGRPLSETELPPTTSEKSRSVPNSTPETFIEKVEEKIKEEVEKVEEELHIIPKHKEPVILEQPKEPEITVPVERIKMLEKYVYHAMAEGFKSDQIRNVLLKKGWPEPVVKKVLEHVNFTDEHIESHDLHTHTEVERAVEPIKNLLAHGFDEDHIRQGLRRKGWKPEQIDELFSKI
ncbi:hypothetical protein ACFL96_11330 [Thermoproteota archaeon]